MSWLWSLDLVALCVSLMELPHVTLARSASATAPEHQGRWGHALDRRSDRRV